jgi:hypothetical protein
MQVLLDLRAPHLVQLQSQKVDATRILSVVLFIVFFFMSIGNIAYTTLKYVDVKQQLGETQSSLSQARTLSAQLDVKIKAFRAKRDELLAHISFTRMELPCVEFLQALEDALPESGLKIKSVSMTEGNVKMSGAALTEKEIVEFGAKLDSLKYIVTNVSASTTRPTVIGTKQIVGFDLSCAIKNLIDVTADSPLRTGNP